MVHSACTACTAYSYCSRLSFVRKISNVEKTNLFYNLLFYFFYTKYVEVSKEKYHVFHKDSVFSRIAISSRANVPRKIPFIM